MDRHPIFFVTDWYIFEVVCWVLVRLICSRSLFFPCLLLLVNTSVISCIFCKYVLHPSLRYVDVCGRYGRLAALLSLGLCDLVTSLAVGGVD